MEAFVVSVAAISPVLARIATIEARFGIGSSSTASAEPAVDFASMLAAASGTSTTYPTAGTTTSPTTASTIAPTIAPSTTGWGASATGSTSGATATTSTTSTAGATGSSGLDPSSPYAAEFIAAGTRSGVPPELLSAVGFVESRYRTDAVSSAGAIGLMQIMPFVATELGVDPNDPVQAIDGAARLLKSHYDRFGSWDLALAAYNAGAGAVARAGDAIPSPGVAEYVRRVNERMQTA